MWLKPGAWGCKTKGRSYPVRRGFRPATYRVSRTFYLSAYGLRQASVLGGFAGAHVVIFNLHNLDQIPKGIPGEETRPKWQRSGLSDFITRLGERRPIAVQIVHFDTKMMGRILR